MKLKKHPGLTFHSSYDISTEGIDSTFPLRSYLVLLKNTFRLFRVLKRDVAALQTLIGQNPHSVGSYAHYMQSRSAAVTLYYM